VLLDDKLKRPMFVLIFSRQRVSGKVRLELYADTGYWLTAAAKLRLAAVGP
jgi:hypothetical protein